ncbi:hypothetical protein BJ973_000310 [Actinoplanes tereljensis]
MSHLAVTKALGAEPLVPYRTDARDLRYVCIGPFALPSHTNAQQ